MKNSSISRRKFISTAGTAAALAAIPFNYSFSIGNQQKKPNSKVNGVQLGCTTYSYGSMPHNVEEVIEYLLYADINTIELRNVAEESMGVPKDPARPPRGIQLSEKEKADFAKAAKEAREIQRKWRLSLPMQKYTDMRRKFNTAGIDVHIYKLSTSTWSDEEIDYAFKASKALGAIGVSDEISEAEAQRLGKFAEKYKSLAILHSHSQAAQPGWTFDKFLAYSPANMLSFDAGHYFGATGLHPNGIIERLHNRISNIHIKDKTGPKNKIPNTNTQFGQGETPIADILLLLKKEKWPIYVDVEMEYKIPEGSDASKEVKKCIDYMRNILE
jgi:hypothetical protein